MADTDNLSRRRFLQATGGAATAAALAGCSGGGGTDTTTTNGTSGTSTTGGGNNTPQELSLINSTITTLDPIAATDTASGRVIMQIYDALMNYPNGLTTTEKLLAKDYTVSEDFKTYTFTLADATYHNGDKVTASDVKYSFERLAASENSRRAYFILSSLGVKHQTVDNDDKDSKKNNYKPGTLAIETPDEKTVKLHLKEPFHASLEMLAYSSFSVIPEGYVGDIQGYKGKVPYKEFSASKPMGAGPFAFEKWESGTQCVVSQYQDYYGEVPKVSRIHWQIMEDDTARYNYAMNKNADLFGIPTAKYDPEKVHIENTDKFGRKTGTYGPARNGETLQYLQVPTILSYYVGFNMEKVPKPVRQAFAYAMDQPLMVDQVFKGRGQPAYHFTPPGIYPNGADAYTQHATQKYPYGYGDSAGQLEKARQVMEQAGYGQNNRFTVNWTQYKSSSWLQMAKILRDQLSSAYIDMNIQQAEFSTLLKRGRQGNLEAYTLGWIADWPAPDNFLQLLNPPQTQTEQPGAVSYINWSQETGSAAQKAAQAYQRVLDNPEPTEAAQKNRNEAYVAIEEANWEDVGFLNVYHGISEGFWYDYVDVTPWGPMGRSRQKFNSVALQK